MKMSPFAKWLQNLSGLSIHRKSSGDLQLAKDSHGGEADCKELVNPWWVIRQFFTDGSPTPYGYTAGVRPIKVASLGT